MKRLVDHYRNAYGRWRQLHQNRLAAEKRWKQARKNRA